MRSEIGGSVSSECGLDGGVVGCGGGYEWGEEWEGVEGGGIRHTVLQNFARRQKAP